MAILDISTEGVETAMHGPASCTTPSGARHAFLLTNSAGVCYTIAGATPFEPVSDADIVANCGVGGWKARSFFEPLLQLGSLAGEKDSKARVLTGDTEGDAHGLRSFIVKATNQNCQAEIA